MWTVMRTPSTAASMIFPLLLRGPCLLLIASLFISKAFAGHHLAAGYNRTWIQTTRDDRFTLHSPALHYSGDLSVHQTRIHFSLSFLLPKWASQNGRQFDSADYYTRYFGADLFIGFSKDKQSGPGFKLVPAGGWHINGIRMRGNARILDFYSLTSGPGIQLMMHYRARTMVPEYLLFSCGYDIFDHLYRENKLKRGFCLNVALGYSF
jgi:hypothetical protein